MSTCGETIEWDYADVGMYWAYVDYRNVSKMRSISVAQIFLTAVILRNAHVCMNGSKLYMPPSCFEEYIAKGPRYFLLPFDLE